MGERILITGGTGFVGSHLAQRLAGLGHDVTITGRNRYATGRTFHPRITFARADLRDALALRALASGVDTVFHVGALTAPWGRARDFHDTNVLGTRNVVAACEAQRVRRLVHVSSTAIFFTNQDRPDLPDDAPLAQPFFNAYAASKAEAEAEVQEAVARGLDAVIVRARAVFGPGDNAILPRLLAAAASGRLRTIGDGRNRLDVTYIDNLVAALVLAREKAPRGATFTVTNDEPVELWPWLEGVLDQAGLPRPSRRISKAAVDRLGGALEAVYARLPGHPEPPLTRYSAGLLATTQTFDVRRAKEVLGYRPEVSLAEGTRRTVRHLRSTQDGHAPVAVRLSLLFTGYCTNWQHHVLAGAEHRQVPFHSMAAVLEHPHFGVTLVDTGYAPHFAAHTRRFPFSVYAKVTPVTSAHQESAAAQLAARGIAPEQVQRVLITHFHGDHVAGLRDFPTADFVASGEAWRSVARRSALGAVTRAHVPGLLPDDFLARLSLVERFEDPGIGPFPRAHDLFGDGSVRLIPLPGHAAGQMGVLVQSGPAQRTLLVADAAWTSTSWRDQRLPHPITRLIMANHRQYVSTLSRIGAFAQAFPDVEIVPTHCPEVHERHGGAARLPATTERG